MKPSRTLSEAERVDWLRLARSPNVGPATFSALMERYGSARDAIADLPRLMRRGGGESRPLPTEADAQKEMAALAAMDGRFIASIEPEFPRGLSALEAPPAVIAVLGNPELLQREMIAVVGARNASALGRKFASSISRELAAAGLVVVSGLARGIDAAAHEGSLATGTCAVVAGGVDYVYPPENRDLYQRLREEGVILSEMPTGLVPHARHFPRRNRIISGLARGVVVVEAAEGSGSLITANYALEQGREIFAVPGSPLDPRAKGTNRLIRDGATLTECADDVIAVLRPIIGSQFREPDGPGFEIAGADFDAEVERHRARVVESLSPAPVEIDELARQCAVPVPMLLAILLELELAGRLQRHPGGRVGWA